MDELELGNLNEKWSAISKINELKDYLKSVGSEAKPLLGILLAAHELNVKLNLELIKKFYKEVIFHKYPIDLDKPEPKEIIEEVELEETIKEAMSDLEKFGLLVKEHDFKISQNLTTDQLFLLKNEFILYFDLAKDFLKQLSKNI